SSDVTAMPPDDIDPAVAIQTVSTAVPSTILPLRHLGAMRRLNINQTRADEYLTANGSTFFFCVTRETVDPTARLHARMLSYNGEDPANGSASGCAAAWMVPHGVAQPD